MAQIALLGLGVVGTSLGLALRRDNRWSNVIGFDLRADVRRSAVANGALLRGAGSAIEAVRDADLVVLNGAARGVIEWIQEVASALKRGAVVTDTAGAKQPVLDAARTALPSTVDFLGGHPIVRPLGPDVRHADPTLFRRRTWYLTATPAVRPETIDLVSSMVDVTEGVTCFVDPAEHDSWCAGVEQLPALLAAALVESVGKEGGWREMQRLAAAEFRDTTRLASDDPVSRSDEARALRQALTPWLDSCMDSLQTFRMALMADDTREMSAILRRAKEIRDSWVAAEEQGFPDEHAAAIDSLRPSLTARFPFRRRT